MLSSVWSFLTLIFLNRTHSLLFPNDFRIQCANIQLVLVSKSIMFMASVS